MDISREEAQWSLDEVQDTVERTRKMVAYAGGDALFVVWGVIWVLGYLGSQFLPIVRLDDFFLPLASWLWPVLVCAGIVISVIVGKRSFPVTGPESARIGRRIGALWGLLYLYFNVWIGLLWPFIKVQGAAESQMFSRHMGAIAGTVPMFAYVVMGLWLGNFMIWIGLAVTALTVLGLFLFPAYFSLWMALAGGGTLIGTGVVIRKRWR